MYYIYLFIYLLRGWMRSQRLCQGQWAVCRNHFHLWILWIKLRVLRCGSKSKPLHLLSRFPGPDEESSSVLQGEWWNSGSSFNSVPIWPSVTLSREPTHERYCSQGLPDASTGGLMSSPQQGLKCLLVTWQPLKSSFSCGPLSQSVEALYCSTVAKVGSLLSLFCLQFNEGIREPHCSL